jgi:NDP-sugar pyrophosphorylase family protein
MGSLNVLIPMAGQGKRFQRAGYSTYKPFVKILGKPMIQYVLDAFPVDVTKRVLADRALLSADELEYLQRQPGVEVHFVEGHCLGPAYTIYAARDVLPLDEAFFIAYCDIYWTWSYADVQRALGHDGVVFTHRAFHPHLVGSNYSAFCKPTMADPDRLQAIREKGSFTDDWMAEPLSIGCFYVRDGEAMMQAITAMIEADQRVGDEFFPSLLFNALVERGQNVRLHDVDFFVHWGVPEQLADVLKWVRTLEGLHGSVPASPYVNVCCMGGAGVRMRAAGDRAKALLAVADDVPMFRYVAGRFGSTSTHYIVDETLVAPLRAEGVESRWIVNVGPRTRSQLETLRKARTLLLAQERFLLTSCDAFGIWDQVEFDDYLDRVRPDAVVFTFAPTLLQGVMAAGHTHVGADGVLVKKIHIKSKPHADLRGLAGFFWFRDGRVFDKLGRIHEDAGRELCADHILKDMVERGRVVGAYPLDAYIHLGSQAELQEFEFWRKHRGALAEAEGNGLMRSARGTPVVSRSLSTESTDRTERRS